MKTLMKKRKENEENDYDLFYKLITEYIYERARDLSKVLKLNYVGVKRRCSGMDRRIFRNIWRKN